MGIGFSVSLFPYARWGGIPAIVDAARRAEELGFAAVSIPEHVAMPVHDKTGDEVGVWYDTAVLGATIAAATKRLRLVLAAAVIPYRHPVDTAKRIATLDQVSGGRVTLIAGTGWMRREFTALGVDHAARGVITDEYLQVIRLLWTGTKPAYDGDRVRFPPLHTEPRCVQSPHVPVWVGGSSGRRAPLLRAARFGDGWAPANSVDDATARADLEFLAAERERCGRADLPFTVSHSMQFGTLDETTEKSRNHVGRLVTASPDVDVAPPATAEQARDEVGRLIGLGAGQISVLFGWSSPAEYLERLAEFAENVMPEFAAR
ncbi:TIGR03619 family F420-dependent LLM class oxidoreductase [Nocardia fusca]|uniref:TIGR03619 family F420-dependent LLM class oxidoreductase n=1 Tax=Nocardia fusca TaxID=941183 RepID=UPI003795CEA9